MQDNEIALREMLEADEVKEKLRYKFSGNGIAQDDGLLLIRTANERIEHARKQPEMKQLFGTYWQTDEVAILAGDTGVGKSPLGVEIADAISSGRQEYLRRKCEVDNQGEKVLYFDFELGDRMFEKRYKDRTFSDKFLLATINPEYYGNEELCINSIREKIIRSDARIVIIDNIMALVMKSTADANESLPLIKKIIDIARNNKLSILIMAHVPKGTKGKPLDVDDLAGSKLIANHVDSIFFIAQAREDKQRYLKQVKARNCERKSKCDLLEIKFDQYLYFEYIGEDYENELLQVFDKQTKKLNIDWDNIFDGKEELRTIDIVKIAKDEYGCGKRSVEDQITNAVGSILDKVKRGVYRMKKKEQLPQLPQAPAESAELRKQQ